MNILPYEIIINICEYLYNETVFALTVVNKHCYTISNYKTFLEYIIYRDHPVVFNLIDNFCLKCNLRCVILLEDNFIHCKHIL